MHYNIKEIPEAEFQTMRRYVERAYARVHPKSFEQAQITIATTDIEDIPMSKRKAHQLNEQYAGWAFRPENYIWLRPGRSPFETRRTAIHEIAHLQSEGDAHGPKWRKTFGIAWAGWLRAHGHSWADVKYEIYNNVRRYRHYRQWTPQGNWNSYDSYLEKVRKEVDDTVRMAQGMFA